MNYFLSLTLFLLAGAGTPASASELGDKEATTARKLYVAKCAKCHKFHEPKNYSEAAWGKWMNSMSKKSKLNTEQDRLVSKYLEEYRAGKIDKIPK